MSLSESIILITGASAGMGKSAALYFAEKGKAKAITLFARRKEALEEVAKQVEAFGTKALVVVGDSSSLEDNKRAVEETVKAFGGITSKLMLMMIADHDDI